MLDFTVWHLGLIWVGIVFWEIGKAIVRKIKTPYQWKCPQCDFKIRTNIRESFEITKSSHNHISTREYK